MNIEYYKLKLLLFFSKSFSKKYKKLFSDSLCKKIQPSNFNKIKFMFSHVIRLDSYDVFTSGILATHYKNVLSLQLLNRFQLELLLFTDYIISNPNNILTVFNKSQWSDKNYQSYFKNLSKDSIIKQLKNFYHFNYSNNSHPLPTRFLSRIHFGHFLKPKENIDLDYWLYKHNNQSESVRNKKIKDTFEFTGFAPSVHFITHTIENKSQFKQLIIHCLILHHKVKENLLKIEEICPDDVFSDDIIKDAIKKHKQS